MAWPAGQFTSLPIEVECAVHDAGAQNDAARIDQMADRYERETKALPCGFGRSYQAAYLASLRYLAECVRTGRNPWLAD